jgi:DNA polymerase I-like protein with 3'-5' exonuclease and polymerase domains
MDWIEETNNQEDIVPFTIVHDAIIAEVKIEKVHEFVNKVTEFVSKDRGISIPGCPILMEFKVGPNWGEAIEISTSVTEFEIRDILDNKRYVKPPKK